MIKYPFDPDTLDALPEELAELFRTLEIDLLEKIAVQLQTAGKANEVTIQSIKALRSHGISIDEITKAISDTTGLSEKRLDALFGDVIKKNEKYYTGLIDLAKLTTPETLVDAAVIDGIVKQTMGELRNITRSTAFLVGGGQISLPPSKVYQWALDSAIMQMQSGAVSYNQAIANATKQLADSGLRYVDYESGKTDHIDVAVRRAVMTGIGQVNEQYNIQSLEYLETDLVEVSAHAGARNTGEGFENHESWQGKIYRWDKYPRTSKGNYPDFIQTCGLGDVQGIHGANCRHWYSPFIEGVMEQTYTQEYLDGLKAENHIIEFEGVQYDGYQATQKQREIERTIRHWKRREAAATNSEDRLSAKARVQILNKKYKEFSKTAGLRLQVDRMKIK